MATALESASLVMVPCGYEDGTLGSLQPTDGSGDFTFTRGSNLSATRVNAAGNIEKGYENLLRQSNSFDTTWTTSNAGVTSGQSGYDGSNNAWLLEKTNSDAQISQLVSANNLNTLSIYAKAATSSWLRFNIVGYANGFINLSNGDIGSIQGAAGITAATIDVGGGWYRCSFIYNTASTYKVSIIVADSDRSTSSPTGSIYIQDAMLNQGLVAYPYIETTTTSAQGGILEDTPRIDYSSGPNGSLLLEPSRTNFVQYSEAFSQWDTFTGVAITSNSTTSPEGVVNASLLYTTGGTSLRYFRKNGMPTASTPKALSVYAKANSSNFIQLLHSGDGEGFINFDVLNGVLGTSGSKTSGDIESVGNGWYRCVAYLDSTNVMGASVFIALANSSIAPYGGGNTSDTLSAYIYGAQYEDNAPYATSLIPTYGTSVTRAGEVCGSAGNATTFNDAEGVLYAEMATLANDGTRAITLSDGSNNNSVLISYNTNGRLDVNLRSGGAFQAIFNYTGVANPFQINKIAFKYKQNDFALWVNGVEVGTDFSGITPVGLDRLNLSNPNKAANFFYGNVKQVVYFQTALSDAALIELTTL